MATFTERPAMIQIEYTIGRMAVVPDAFQVLPQLDLTGSTGSRTCATSQWGTAAPPEHSMQSSSFYPMRPSLATPALIPQEAC